MCNICAEAGQVQPTVHSLLSTLFTCLCHQLCHLHSCAAGEDISHGVKDAVLSQAGLHACIPQAVHTRTVAAHNAADHFLQQTIAEAITVSDALM